MKYFTPELLDRFGSSDDRVADAAQDEWEEKLALYEEKLKSIARRLPPDLLKLHEGFRLHDGRANKLKLENVECGFGRFWIEVIPEASSRSNLLLTYELCESPTFSPSLVAAINNKKPLFWAYDEIDEALVTGSDGGPTSIFSHSILFDDGSELRLAFKSFSLTEIPLEATAPPVSTFAGDLAQGGAHQSDGR